MEDLIKQTRVRFSSARPENKEDNGSIRERKIPPQKSLSFKGDKTFQNWFRKQLSKHASQEYDSSDGGEYATAIAAAAFAVNTLGESSIRDKDTTREGLETTPGKTKIRKDVSFKISEADRASTRLSDQGSIKVSEGSDKRVPKVGAENGKIPEKRVTIKKAPTFADELLNKPPQRVESIKPPPPSLKHAEPIKPPPPPPPLDTKRQVSAKPGIGETEADVWEKTEMAKIKERHQKLQASILSWENNKKIKARRKMDKTESELEGQRGRASRHYRREMERIDQVSGGAKAQALERQRNEEFKVQEKANKFRLTGEEPVTCICF